MRQGLGQQPQPLLGLAALPIGLGEQGKIHPTGPSLSPWPVGGETLVHLRHALLALSLRGQRPAPVDRRGPR